MSHYRLTYLSVSNASQKLIPSLIDVLYVRSNTLSRHWRLRLQHVCEMIQQLNVAIMIVRLNLEHLQ